MPRVAEQIEWLSLIDISGPFLAGTVLEEIFPQGLEKVETPRRHRLRSAYDEWRDAIDEDDEQLEELHAAWMMMVLQEMLEYEDTVLIKKDKLDDSIVFRAPEHGAEVKPDFAVRTDDGEYRLLIAMYPPETDIDKPLAGDNWSASPAERMVMLCRASEVQIGLVTNGEQWMLVNAPIGNTSGYATWLARLWWQEPITLKAFQSLLGIRRFFGPGKERLDQLLERSISFQKEITDTLGGQVRRAVEVLIQALGRADQDRNGELLKDIPPAELYEAGLTVMMRLVFILCAEERGLLLLDDPIYDQYYAVSTLRGQLREDADHHGVEVLERRHDAWSRILAVFRAVYGGVEHEALRLPALGGSLFDPDRFAFLEGRAHGTTWRDEPASPLPIDNRTVLLLLTALQVLEQRNGARLLSYRALDVEQIGHVYEGLLEHTATRVPEITLGLVGTKKHPNPSITLTELEALETQGEKQLLDRLKGITGRSIAALRKAVRSEENESRRIQLIQACGGDEQLTSRIVPFGGLVRADSWGHMLVFQAGTWAIVKGAGRRETGTHYTPRSLTEPIVQYTLEPLVYEGPSEGKDKKDWQLKSAADILALNVCDMACGSGAFLVEVCRYLGQRLVEAWAKAEKDGSVVSMDGVVLNNAGDHELMPTNLDDRLLIARRLIAQSCIYGVDINPLAVELAKLSIWLVTLAKNKPFGFLDHAIRCGDSLVGLHDLKQLKKYSLDCSGQQLLFNKVPLDEYVNEAIKLRLKLEDMPANTVADIKAQEMTLKEAEDKITRLKCAADLLVAAEFWAENATDKQQRVHHAAVVSGHFVENGPTDEFKRTSEKERQGQRMFHWPLEFPEVIVKQVGFDAFVGNPPFIGAKKISSSISGNYRDFIVSHVSEGTKGNADLCSYFFLRVVSILREYGCYGLLATNSIGQGDTRNVGLARLCEQGCSVYRAVPNRNWPGLANVTIAEVWGYRGSWGGESVLNGRSVTGISSFLTLAGEIHSTPNHLFRNKGIAFQGSNVLGLGFTLSKDKAIDLVHCDHQNQDVVLPYLNGQDLSSSPTQQASRWIINFNNWPLDRVSAPHDYVGPVASDYPICLDIVKTKVKPQRDELGKKRDASAKGYAKHWWQYARKAIQLYETISTLENVIVCTRTSKLLIFCRIPSGFVFADRLVVFATQQYFHLALLSSSIHGVWAWEYGSTIRNAGIIYNPSTCFETFPFPETRNVSELTELGMEFEKVRRELMLAHGKGLTQVYNCVNDVKNTDTDIQRLRELLIMIDQAVVASYGWDDINLNHGFYETKQDLRYTISEFARREVLQRLLKLNHKRYEEEVMQGLHDKKRKRIKKKIGKSKRDKELFD